MVKFLKWADSKIRKIDALDMGLVKLSVFAFALILAKLWPQMLSLDWYWYAAVFILAAIRPMKRAYF